MDPVKRILEEISRRQFAYQTQHLETEEQWQKDEIIARFVELRDLQHFIRQNINTSGWLEIKEEEEKKEMGKRFSTVKQISEHYPGVFTASSLRWLIFNEKQNGLSECIRRIGKKVLIDLDLFDAWIDKQK
jgi:hypothetical protein